jgi:hypothetical protein
MIIISSRLCQLFSWFTGFSKSAKAVTVFPFIFVRSETELIPWLIIHERIHIRHQIELLLIGSIILYIIEFLYAFLWLRYSWQEAYRNQNDFQYLKTRKIFSQFYYLFHKSKFTHKDGEVTVT